jgi:hypothetical protein
MSARSSEPRNSDAPADLKRVDAAANHVDPADDFMARNNRKLWIRQFAVDNVKVGAAHAAGADANPDLTVSRLGIRPLDRLERFTRVFQYHCAHFDLGLFSNVDSPPPRPATRAAQNL